LFSPSLVVVAVVRRQRPKVPIFFLPFSFIAFFPKKDSARNKNKHNSSNMSVSQTKVSQLGPELRGGNINLDSVLRKTDVSTRQTKIICTLGPACWEVDQLEELINTGLCVARFNFSHGDHEGHKACLDRLREAIRRTGKHVGTFIAAELCVRGILARAAT
jgi:hypothetical protein